MIKRSTYTTKFCGYTITFTYVSKVLHATQPELHRSLCLDGLVKLRAENENPATEARQLAVFLVRAGPQLRAKMSNFCLQQGNNLRGSVARRLRVGGRILVEGRRRASFGGSSPQAP